MPNRNTIRPIVRGAYDLQMLRIQMGNRLVANFKAKLGQPPGVSEEESLEGDEQDILRDLRRSYKRITDGVVGKRRKALPREFEPDELISDYTELALVDQYVELLHSEKRTFDLAKEGLEDFPIYTEYLSKVKGIGVALAGVLISEIDIHAATYPSSLWKYAGLDVAQDGRGRSRRAEHLIDREYLDKDKKVQTKKSITFNPFLKTKLIGVLAPSFLRAGNERYGTIYADYKNRLLNHEKYKDVSKGHRHNMALRVIAKAFLLDLYKVWREMEGLVVAPPYHESKLGIYHRDPQRTSDAQKGAA